MSNKFLLLKLIHLQISQKVYRATQIHGKQNVQWNCYFCESAYALVLTKARQAILAKSKLVTNLYSSCIGGEQAHKIILD